jgi:hypothetical protein
MLKKEIQSIKADLQECRLNLARIVQVMTEGNIERSETNENIQLVNEMRNSR